MKSLHTQVASIPDRENVVFEIWDGQYEVAELSHEPEQALRIEIYPPPNGKTWNFEFEEFNTLLKKGAKALGCE